MKRNYIKEKYCTIRAISTVQPNMTFENCSSFSDPIYAIVTLQYTFKGPFSLSFLPVKSMLPNTFIYTYHYHLICSYSNHSGQDEVSWRDH